MNIVGLILRVYSYIYHFILGLFLTALGALALSSGTHNLNLGMLPWKGEALTWWTVWLGITAIVTVILAVTGWFRWLFPLWCLFVVIMMIKGFFLTPTYVFAGAGHFKGAVWLTIGAIGAFLSSLMLYKRARTRY